MKLLSRLVNILKIGNQSSADSLSRSTGSGRSDGLQDEVDVTKAARFAEIILVDSIDTYKLREMVWSGCPRCRPAIRGVAWKVLIGFYPPRVDRHGDVRLKKAKEYQSLMHEHVSDVDSSSAEGIGGRAIFHQIEIDIPRTVTFELNLVRKPWFLGLIRRVLIIWSLRNPACGYVQGMNDVLVPLLLVLIEEAADSCIVHLNDYELDPESQLAIESDLYWMFSRVIQGVQDHYTSSQPGIQKMMKHFRDVMYRVDKALVNHLEDSHVDLQQISFKWFNCFLTRELNYESLIRVWDTCLAEEDGFSVFLVYFCVVLVIRHSKQLQQSEFQDIMTLLSNSRELFGHLTVREVDAIISEAFVFKSLFHSSPSHLNSC